MSLFKRKKQNQQYGWFGDYADWDELAGHSGGYEKDIILEKTKDSLLKIKNGQAVYERDSVLFDEKLYPYPLITSLLYAALHNGKSLNVLDFGGSLGSTYYQVRDFFPAQVELSWSVVEQTAYVTCGQDFFEDDILKFHYSIPESMAYKKADVLVLSSVVQYLKKPHDFLDNLQEFNFKYILVDRTSFIKAGKDRLTKQVVPPEIYEAQYPAWFFNENDFLAHFTDYEKKAEFTSYVPGEQEMEIDHIKQGYDKGFLLVKKS